MDGPVQTEEQVEVAQAHVGVGRQDAVAPALQEDRQGRRNQGLADASLPEAMAMSWDMKSLSFLMR